MIMICSARISVSRGKNATKMEDLCARMHNNTALEGASPLEMMQATAFDCQKKCVDMFPACTAVVYYYLHNDTKHHFCYLFEQNSIDEKVELVEQKPEHKKDLVRMLEIVPDCHLFDAHPPLEEDGLASSTDKVDRKKRQQGNEAVLGTGSWTDWSDCSNHGHEIRSQVCDYGRKIQRRGCPARQAQQRQFAPPPRQPYPQPAQPPQQLSLSPRAPSRPIPPQPAQRSPYDEYAQLYQQRMSQYRVNQRHPAQQQADPCPGGRCEPYPPAPTRPPMPPPRSAYKPAPPTPPQCGSKDCAPVMTQGIWHDWSEWSQCSCTCDDGMRARRRECSTNNCQVNKH
ncbi:hypothetical protein WR25_07127 [Diploscapter pachys]|uniref:Apple domain-containing protein n=1 Tax=Diploscapter pachys TaxID=2018661 RepID=A0A2A2JF56_9BILA|nr:hypothetical protein WR25_07127 [Diploscapter pachys]